MIIDIPANDHGKIRIFSLTGRLPSGLIEKEPRALLGAFGTTALNPDYVDVVKIAALDDMTLHDLLVHGYDITPDPIDDAALVGITDHAILIMSRATQGKAVTLELAPGIHHVTTCGDAAQLNVPTPLEADTAQGTLEDAPASRKSDAAIGGRVAMFALIVMFAIFGLMVWIGG